VRLIVATNNAGKRAELRALLPTSVELMTLRDAGVGAPEETGTTFEQNALIKAHAVAQLADGAIADDSGLEVDALGGQPGVYSARFAGPDATDAENNQELLRQLAEVSCSSLGARFVSVVAFVDRSGRQCTASGTIHGRIIAAPRGSGGFGYDPLFEIADTNARAMNGRTMAELTLPEKNRVSHRARAYRALIRSLEDAGIVLGDPPASQASR
jgi:XTP/dITP diphosphohydrolase